MHTQTELGKQTKYMLGDFSNPRSPEFTDITKNVIRKHDYSQLYMGDQYAAWIQENNGTARTEAIILETKETFTIDAGVGVFQTLFFVQDKLAIKGKDGKSDL